MLYNTQLNKLNTLATFMSDENCYKLKQYIWWSKHCFIESFKIEKEQEYDDMGSYYDVYYLRDICIGDTTGFINYLVEAKQFGCIRKLLNLDSSIKFNTKQLQDLTFMNNLYLAARSIKNNESNYNLTDILDSSEAIDFFIFHQDAYKIIDKNPDKEIIQDWIDDLIYLAKTFIFNYG